MPIAVHTTAPAMPITSVEEEAELTIRVDRFNIVVAASPAALSINMLIIIRIIHHPAMAAKHIDASGNATE